MNLLNTDFSIFTVQSIFLFIVGLAAVVASITVIINAISSLKTKNREFVNGVVEQKFLHFEKRIDCNIESAFLGLKADTVSKIDNLATKLDSYIAEDRQYKHQKDKEFLEVVALLKSSNIESYKNDIRSIYYRLRETGEISDYDKSYIDSIFPLYTAMGGNSDIEAKYKEICEVYGKITQERFDKKREEKRRKKAEGVSKV